MCSCRVGLGRARHRCRGELRQLPQRMALRQVRPEPPVSCPAPQGSAMPGPKQLDGVSEDGAERGEFIKARRGPLGEQEEDRAEQGHRHVAGERGQHRPGRQVGQQREHRVAPVQPARPARGRHRAAAARCGLQVKHDGVGDHPDPVAGRMHSPAEIDVVTEQHHAPVEAADLLPHIAPDEHPRAACGQHIAVPVVLALVNLTRLDTGDAAADCVDADPGLQDDLAVGPIHDLRPEHCRGSGLGDTAEQLLKRIGGRFAVVMEQPDPLHALVGRRVGRAGNADVGRAVLQRALNGRRVPGAPVHAEDNRLAEEAGEHSAAAVPAAGVDGHDPLDRPGLLKEGFDDLGQPRGAVVRDDDRRDDVLRVGLIRRQLGSACCSEGYLQVWRCYVRTGLRGRGHAVNNTRTRSTKAASRRPSRSPATTALAPTRIRLPRSPPHDTAIRPGASAACARVQIARPRSRSARHAPARTPDTPP